MQKLLKLWLCFFCLLFALYSGLWLYQASRINSLIENGKLLLTDTLGLSSVSFFYSRATLSGFPFSFIVRLEKPHFIIGQATENLTLRPSGSLIIHGSLFSNILKVSLPKTIMINNHKSLSFDASLQFISRPSMTLALESSSILPVWIASSFSNPNISFSSVSYENQGFKLLSDLNVPLLSGQHHQINLLYQDQLHDALATHLIVQADNLTLDALLNEPNHSPLFDSPISFSADIMLITPYVEGRAQQATNIRVNEINYQSNDFNLRVFADFSSSMSDIYPFGKMQIALHDYAYFVDYHALLINYVLDRTEFLTASINKNQCEGIKQALKSLSSQTYNNEKDITLQLSRHKQGKLLIGKYPMDNILSLLEKQFSTN